MQFFVNPVQKQGNIKWKLPQRMEHCNWLIKKRNTEEPIRCRNLYWPLKVARKTGSVLCRIALWDCLEANFHPVNFLSWMLFKNNNTSFVPQFGIDLLVISRGLWKLPGFYLYVIDTNFWIWFMYWKLVGLSDPLDPGALTAPKVLCWIRVEPIPLLLRTV